MTSVKHIKVTATSILEHSGYYGSNPNKTNYDRSHPTHHRPASLWWNYSRTVVSIMKLVMEDGWWWRWRRIPLAGAPNGLQICPPEEEQGLAAAPHRKTRWFLLFDFFLSKSKYIELELASEGFQGAHEVGGHALGGDTLVRRVWAPWSSSLARIFYCFF